MLFDSFCCHHLLSLKVTISVVWEHVRITTGLRVSQKLKIEFHSAVYSQNSYVSWVATRNLTLAEHLGSSTASSDLNQCLEVGRIPSSTDVRTSTVASVTGSDAVVVSHIEWYSNYFSNCRRAMNEHPNQHLSTASSPFGTAEEAAV